MDPCLMHGPFGKYAKHGRGMFDIQEHGPAAARLLKLVHPHRFHGGSDYLF